VKTQIALIGTVLVAGTALLGSPASARAIRTDSGNFNCIANTSALAFNPGLTGKVDVCTFSGTTVDDQEIGVGPFEADVATVYSWDGGNAGANWQSSVQVAVYTLDGNDGSGNPTSLVANGDTEFAFNYINGNGTCLVSALASTPTLTFDKKTYRFTGAGGAGICDAASTSDFVFSPTGYVGWINDDSMLETKGLPPGWSPASTSVPEPDSFALALIGGFLAAAFTLTRRRRVGP
jgi:hypothetical protein